MAPIAGIDSSYLGETGPSTDASRLRSMLLRMSGEGENNVALVVIHPIAEALGVEAAELFRG